MPNDMLVSQAMISDDQITEIYKSSGEFFKTADIDKGKSESVNTARMIRLAWRGTSPAASGYLSLGSLLLDQHRIWFDENEGRKVAIIRETKPIMEVIEMSLIGRIKEQEAMLREKDEIINEQASRLNVFERIRRFESNGLDLPDDYYENDAYFTD